MSEYYDHGTFPTPNTKISSAGMRAELDNIEAGFNKLPVLAGNAGKVVKVKADASGLETGLLGKTDVGLGNVDNSPDATKSVLYATTAGNITGVVAVENGGTGATTQIGALQALGSLAAQTVAKTAAYTVVAADRGDVVLCTGTWTLAFTGAATLGDGFSFAVANTGTGVITLNPSSAEQIDGATTKLLTAGQSCIVVCNGASFNTVGMSSSGGATGGGADQVFYENGQSITTDYTVTAGKNAMTAGPISINSGVTVTVPDGSVWIVI